LGADARVAADSGGEKGVVIALAVIGATGSRECAPDDKLSEAIQSRRWDSRLLRRKLLAMTVIQYLTGNPPGNAYYAPRGRHCTMFCVCIHIEPGVRGQSPWKCPIWQYNQWSIFHP